MIAKLKAAALSAALVAAVSSPAAAERVALPGALPVDEAVANVAEAVRANGDRVFLTVDFRRGAAGAGVDMRPTTAVLFGGPEIGAAALAEAQTLGLFVPLRLLAWEDAAGKVWISYEDPADVAPLHGLSADHPGVARMRAALARYAAVAAGE